MTMTQVIEIFLKTQSAQVWLGPRLRICRKHVWHLHPSDTKPGSLFIPISVRPEQKPLRNCAMSLGCVIRPMRVTAVVAVAFWRHEQSRPVRISVHRAWSDMLFKSDRFV